LDQDILIDRTVAQLGENLNLSAEDKQSLLQASKPKQLKQGQFFIEAGQTCGEIAILQTGIFRTFYLANDKEYTSYFNTEDRNPIIGAFTSFLRQKPSVESVVALEDSQYQSISKEELEGLYESHPNIQKMGRLLAEYNYVLAMERIYDLQHSAAKTRYEKFLALYPNVINRIPHYHIASYIGVTPESLSRLRKSVGRN
jgi:CRP-like cAMP-binding protein